MCYRLVTNSRALMTSMDGSSWLKSQITFKGAIHLRSIKENEFFLVLTHENKYSNLIFLLSL